MRNKSGITDTKKKQQKIKLKKTKNDDILSQKGGCYTGTIHSVTLFSMTPVRILIDGV